MKDLESISNLQFTEAPSIEDDDYCAVINLLSGLGLTAETLTPQALFEFSRNELLWVFRDTGRIVGLLACSKEFTLAGKFMHMREIAVSSSHASRGIDKELLRTALKDARKHRYDIIELATPPKTIRIGNLMREYGFVKRSRRVWMNR